MNLSIILEKTEKEFAGNCVGEETSQKTHHSETTVHFLGSLSVGFKTVTLGVRRVDEHFRLRSPDVHTTEFVGSVRH